MRLSKSTFKLVTLFGSLALVLTYNACGAGMPVAGFIDKSDISSVGSASVNLSDATAVQNSALQILATNCTACHLAQSGPGNVFNVTDPSHLIQSGLVVPGSPDTSPLLAAIEANRMPPASPLSGTDKTVIRTWIAGGAKPPTVPPTVPPPSQPPTPIPLTPTTGTLEEKAVAILQNNCYACHGTASNGGVTHINDPAALITAGLIIPGNAVGSTIYDAVAKGRMPVGGMLSQADITILADWINAGAKAPTAGTVPPPPALPPLGPSYQSLSANVFFPRCVGCHSATLATSGVRMDTYASVMSLVKAGNPSSSKLYDITANGEMPQRPNQPLNSEELRALSDWIKAGAPNN